MAGENEVNIPISATDDGYGATFRDAALRGRELRDSIREANREMDRMSAISNKTTREIDEVTTRLRAAARGHRDVAQGAQVSNDKLRAGQDLARALGGRYGELTERASNLGRALGAAGGGLGLALGVVGAAMTVTLGVGLKVVSMLNDQVRAAAADADEMERLGLITREQADATEAAARQLEAMDASGKAASARLTAELAPALEDIYRVGTQVNLALADVVGWLGEETAAHPTLATGAADAVLGLSLLRRTIEGLDTVTKGYREQAQGLAEDLRTLEADRTKGTASRTGNERGLTATGKGNESRIGKDIEGGIRDNTKAIEDAKRKLKEIEDDYFRAVELQNAAIRKSAQAEQERMEEQQRAEAEAHEMRLAQIEEIDTAKREAAQAEQRRQEAMYKEQAGQQAQLARQIAATNKQRIDDEEAYADASMSLAFATAGALADLAEKSFTNEKASALIQVAVQTALGIAKSFAQNPPPSPLGYIGAAQMAIVGGIQAATIASQNFTPKRHIGGTIGEDAPRVPGGAPDERYFVGLVGEQVRTRNQQGAASLPTIIIEEGDRSFDARTGRALARVGSPMNAQGRDRRGQVRLRGGR